MALYSEKLSITSVDRQIGTAPIVDYPHEVVLVITLEAKRERVLEVKLHRIAAELESITGVRPMTLQSSRGGRAAVLRTGSWVAPDALVRLLRARLEQESPNASMFHFSKTGQASDSVIALQASGFAVM